MAKRRNKSAKIRQAVAAHPKASAKEPVTCLAAQRVRVSPAHCRAVSLGSWAVAFIIALWGLGKSRRRPRLTAKTTSSLSVLPLALAPDTHQDSAPAIEFGLPAVCGRQASWSSPPPPTVNHSMSRIVKRKMEAA